MLTWLGLFYDKMLGIRVHYTFRFPLFLYLFLKRHLWQQLRQPTPTISASLNQTTHSQWFIQWFPTRGITHFITYTERVREKEQMIKHRLGSDPSARKASLCDDFVQLFVHLWTIVDVYFARNFYKATNLFLTVFSHCLLQTVFPLDKPTVLLCPALSNAFSVFSRAFLSSSTSGVAGDLVLNPLCGFCAKTDKEIIWVTPTQTKTNCYASCHTFCSQYSNQTEIISTEMCGFK